ncbi:hypothetical protein D3C86_1478920 [compost metagenome]
MSHVGDGRHVLGHSLTNRNLLRSGISHVIRNLLDGLHTRGDPRQGTLDIPGLLHTLLGLLMALGHHARHIAGASLQVVDHHLDLLGRPL